MQPIQATDGENEVIARVLRALADSQRRRLLYALQKADRGAGLAVPEAIPIGGTDIDLLETKLHHQDLPLLEQAELVRWDEEAGRVYEGPAFREERALIESVREFDGLEARH